MNIPDVNAEQGLTPFMGRQREIDLLLDVYNRTKTSREAEWFKRSGDHVNARKNLERTVEIMKECGAER